MKRCLLICEGPFDELIFSLLKEVFDSSLLEIKPLCRCCVDTTNLKENVEALVGEILAKEHGYLREDFDEVCFLIDSDGVYIPDCQINENKGLRNTEYNNDSIECPDKSSLVSRNQKRRNNIDDLLADLEYPIFYNSRNLEHAFDSSMCGHLNDNAKKRFALRMFNSYEDKYDNFIKRLSSMNSSDTNNYLDSWEYLKKDSNSLSSCSNIFIFLIMHYSCLKDEYKNTVKEMLVKPKTTKE